MAHKGAVLGAMDRIDQDSPLEASMRVCQLKVRNRSGNRCLGVCRIQVKIIKTPFWGSLLAISWRYLAAFSHFVGGLGGFAAPIAWGRLRMYSLSQFRQDEFSS